MKNLKEKLYTINEKLKIEFASSINYYQKNKIANISKKNSAQLNSIFTKKKIAQVDTLKIQANSPILKDVQIDIKQLEKDKNRNIIINTLQDKLNVIGASINNKYYDNNRPQFNKLINNEVNTFKIQTEMEINNNLTLCTFNDKNTADDSKTLNKDEDYFININNLNKKFKKLNNKIFWIR